MWILGGWLECSWRKKRWGDWWVINQSGCVKGLQIQSAMWNGEGKWAPHIYDSFSLTHTPFYLSFSQFLSHTHIHTQSLSRSLSLSLSINEHILSLSQSPAASNEHNTLTHSLLWLRLSLLLIPYWIVYQSATKTSSVFQR